LGYCLDLFNYKGRFKAFVFVSLKKESKNES
jgi:hypothetical protein